MQAVVFLLLLFGAVLSRADDQSGPDLIQNQNQTVDHSQNQQNSQNTETTYSLKVFTGSQITAGTVSKIFVKLVGNAGKSNLTKFAVVAVVPGLESTYSLLSEPLGKPGLLLLKKENFSLVPALSTQWYVEKIEVIDAEGQNYTFPMYHWLTDGLIYQFSEGTAVIQDCYYQAARERELAYRTDTFRWKLYEEGAPYCIRGNSPSELPREIQFSFKKKSDFFITAAEAFLKTKAVFNKTGSWQSFDDIEKGSYDLAKTDLSDYVKHHWREDWFFGYQFLNGLNPMLIRRCSSLPNNFPVTDDMVSLEGGASLTQEMQNGNIFLVDYEVLDGIQTRIINGKQQHLSAPLVLLHKTLKDELKPIAIQLKQTPAEDNPIFLPSDSEYDWLLAKTFVRSADFIEHELNSHLLRTHLVGEVFSLALLKNVVSSHPLFKLLKPHTRYTFQINILARESLISEDGILTENTAASRDGMLTILDRATSNLTYSSLCLPEDITERGLDSVPNYYYRDDGLKMWNIINRFVRGVLSHYYKNDNKKVQEDTELQNYIRDIFELGFLNNTNTGIPQNFQNLDEVVKFVTMVIFTSSAQHAAVNFGQRDFGAWVPNFPSTLQHPPPVTKGTATEETLLSSLPDINTSRDILATLWLLSDQPKDKIVLGKYPYELFTEEVPNALIHDFERELEELQRDVIDPRNKKLAFPYVYMRPDNVENSVTI